MQNGVHSGLPRWFWAAVFVACALAVSAVGYAYYRTETERIRQEKYSELAAIATLKVQQIERWRDERLGDVRRSSQAPFFGQGLRKWLKDPNDSELRAKIQQRLLLEQKEEGFADVLILDTEGSVLLSVLPDPHPLTPVAKQTVEQALAHRTPMLTDLYRCPRGIVHLDAIGPIPGDNGRIDALLVLRSNAQSVLYPLIRSWPTPSRTAETLLVRRDGEEVLFLNDLRHRPDSALSFREPLTRNELPAARAVQGLVGVFQGRDYRGVDVLADLRPIPDSPWFMVAKVDTAEILAEVHYRGGVIVLIATVFIALTANITAYGYRDRQARIYRELYRAEQEQRAALREFRTTLYSIGDAVITTDTQGCVKQMNRIAERLTGKLEMEAVGKPIDEIFHIVNEETRAEVEDPVARVLRDGTVVGLANHTLLISEDGSERSIADSGAPICDESGAVTGVVLVFQDQTETQRRLRERETRLTLLHLLNGPDNTHGMVRNVTKFIQEWSGFTAVGVRLKEGDDFPYFETQGFSPEFVRLENSLCSRDTDGRVQRDSVGNPVLACMCGNVICGRFDPAMPFFTAKGNFWSNGTTKMLARYTDEDRQARTRNRCNGEGYESVALFRLRTGDETLGLLQLNDHSEGRFTPELIDFIETMADQIAIALAQRQAQARLRESEERYRDLYENAPNAYFSVAADGRIRRCNRRAGELLGYPEEELTGRSVLDLYADTPDGKARAREVLQRFRAGESVADEEMEMQKADGSHLWVGLTVNAVQDAQGKLVESRSVVVDITERKHASEALRESEERFRILADGAFEGVVLIRDGAILDSNKVFREKSGYSPEELVGMNFRDVVAPEFRDSTELSVVSESEQPYETAFVRKNGETMPALVKGKMLPYQGGAVRIVSVRDISAARRAEAVQKRLATAIEQSAEAILITDAQGIIGYANPAVERITGFTAEEILGKTPRVFKSGEHDNAFYRALWDTIKTGNIWSGRFVNKRKDGSLFHEDATISPVRSPSGEITSFVAVNRDITEHLELAKQLQQAQKMEAVGTLAGGIAHDFNNLLQAVLGYSELVLSDEDLPDQFKDDLGKILLAGRNGADLVQRLLTFSRKTETKPLDLDLNQRLKQVRKFLERTIPKMIDIELKLSEGVAGIHADPTQIDQVIMNLAVNARDAMPEGGKLVIETANVVLDEEYVRSHFEAKPGKYVLLRVSDSGAGMDKETLEHIFEPFFTTKGPGEGTGLGLAMVYGIVKQHQGFIKCCSKLGQGTTFKIYLPSVAPKPYSEKTVAPSIIKGGSETILLVDDEPPIRELGKRILERAGYKTLTAGDGEEALAIYRKEQSRIALVLLDLVMPGMGGKQCLEKLLEINPNLKVLIASGYSAGSSTKDILAAGAKAFVSKPFDVRLMLEKVRKTLDEGKTP